MKKAPPRTEAVDIDEVILEVLDLSRNELQRNGISIRTQLATGKPLVRVDRIQLQQVVLNLILNAVDAMSEPGTSPRELSIASRREESNQVLVEVRDSGRGFQAETMERIFDPFFTTKIDGMGMGLSISRSIVVAHGGRLWAMANEPRLPVRASGGRVRYPSKSVSYPPLAGRLKRKIAPRGEFFIAHSFPPWASMIEREIASPMPIPSDFVV